MRMELPWWDYYYKKRKKPKSYFSPPCKDKARRQQCPSQEEAPHQNPSTLAPWPKSSSLRTMGSNVLKPPSPWYLLLTAPSLRQQKKGFMKCPSLGASKKGITLSPLSPQEGPHCLWLTANHGGLGRLHLVNEPEPLGIWTWCSMQIINLHAVIQGIN